MYICLECGHHFDMGEEKHFKERHGFTDGLYEDVTGCPLCGGSYATASSCAKCGGHFLEDDLFPGKICRECLIRSITVKDTLRYIGESDAEEKDFYFRHWLGSRFESVSPRLLELVRKAFQDHARVFRENALEVCRHYVAEDDSGLYEYAEWRERQA